MRIAWSLCRSQCRCLAVLGLGGLGLLALLVAIGQVAAGLELALVLSPWLWLGSVTVLLPEFLQVLGPLCLAQGFLSLDEGGELQAARAAGVGPLTIAAALLLPLAPLPWLHHSLVHQARPAALLQARQSLLSTSTGLWSGLLQRGVGTAQSAAGFRAMLPLGSRVVALSSQAPPELVLGVGGATGAGARLELAAGSVQLVSGLDADIDRVGFEAMRLSFPAFAPGLSMLPVSALSSRFLRREALRWRRARLRWDGLASSVLLQREQARRASGGPALLLGLGLVLGLLGWRRRLTPQFVHGVCTPLAIACSLYSARLVVVLLP